MGMPALQSPDPSKAPKVDDLEFHALYTKSAYPVQTRDGWQLIVTRYQPSPQRFNQPLLGEPLLLVHGFSQNRHTWTSGEFVKNLLYFGLDIHIVELRGHGKSSQQLQHDKSALTGRPLPPDLDYGWDLDSYLLHDLPAAVAAVKEKTGRRRIFYVGHSMGGMLGYGYAGLHDDLEGLVTIGAPADLGRGFLLLRLAALTTPITGLLIDTGVAAINFQRRLLALARLLRMRATRFARLPSGDEVEQLEEALLSFNYDPVD